jgi:hypothetical protein
LLTAFVWLFFTPAFAQEPGGIFLPPSNDQTHLFRGLFHFHDIEPVTIANLRDIDYRNLIVVVLGRSQNTTVLSHVKKALLNGGAVLIASKTLTDLGQYMPHAGEAKITGTSTVFESTKNGLTPRTFRGMVVPIPPTPLDLVGERAGIARPEMELFTPFARVEVELPSYLIADVSKRPKELARNVAKFPANTQIDMGNGVWRNATDKHLFALAGSGTERMNPYRCVAIADTSLFTNKLIYTSGRLQDPTDNLKFANHLVQWLKGPAGRSQCLFVENGQVIDRFDEVKFSAIPIGTPMPPIPMPQLNPFNEEFQQGINDWVNNTVKQVQDDNRMNKALADTDDRKAPVYRTLAMLAAIGLIVFIGLRMIGSRFRALFRPIPKDPHRLGPGTVIGSLEHRRLELLRGGDYSVPVRAYIRQLFEERGLPPDYQGEWLPRFRFNLRNRDFVKQAVTTLWKEMNSNKPINYSRWKELEPLVTAARASADDNRWWIELPTDEGVA